MTTRVWGSKARNGGLNEWIVFSGQWDGLEDFEQRSRCFGKIILVVQYETECKRRGLEQMRIWEVFGSCEMCPRPSV